MDRLHALVEQCYKEMSSRVQALEVLNIQHRGDADWISEDDTESCATIHGRPPQLSYEEAIESEAIDFDFSDDLQRSRVYRRNQVFRRSVISALTGSVYSSGWSIFSDLSMAEVSNISVINLAITEDELFNLELSSQTRSTRPKGGFSTDNEGDGERIQISNVAREPVQVESSSMNVRGGWPAYTQRQSTSDKTLPQLLNTRGSTRTASSDEVEQRIDARMPAMGYPISPPISTRLEFDRSEDQGEITFHAKFNKDDFAQHPLYRRSDKNGIANGNSFDDPRPQLARSDINDHLCPNYWMCHDLLCHAALELSRPLVLGWSANVGNLHLDTQRSLRICY